MKNNHSHINEEDFRRYLENRMSESERNRFERELQKHPFEAEALDGFEQLSSNQLQNDIKALRNKILRSKRKNNFRWWAAAASFLLLVTAGIFFFQLNKEDITPKMTEILNERQKPEMTPEDEQSLETAQTLESGEILADTGEIATAGKVKKARKDITAVPYEKKEEAVIAEAVEKEAEAIGESLEMQDNTGRSALKSGADVKLNSESLNNLQPSFLQKTTVYPVDENDVYPDSFKDLSAREREKVQAISGVAVQDRVEIERKIQLKDVDAYPEGGMTEFEQYLKKQAVLPKNFESTQETVNLLLKLDSEGKITGFENRNKSDSALFEKAKKIIRNGPNWKPEIINGQRVPTEISLKIVFRKDNPE